MKQVTPFVSLGSCDIEALKSRLNAEPESAWTKSVAVQRGKTGISVAVVADEDSARLEEISACL